MAKIVLSTVWNTLAAKARADSIDGADEWLTYYQGAVRANRQLATALQVQGLNEETDQFAYRSQKLQRIVLRRQSKYGKYHFSGFLDLLAGYGYRPVRSIIWYLVIIVGFALAYHRS